MAHYGGKHIWDITLPQAHESAYVSILRHCSLSILMDWKVVQCRLNPVRCHNLYDETCDISSVPKSILSQAFQSIRHDYHGADSHYHPLLREFWLGKNI